MQTGRTSTLEVEKLLVLGQRMKIKKGQPQVFTHSSTDWRGPVSTKSLRQCVEWGINSQHHSYSAAWHQTIRTQEEDSLSNPVCLSLLISESFFFWKDTRVWLALLDSFQYMCSVIRDICISICAGRRFSPIFTVISLAPRLFPPRCQKRQC